MMMIPQNAASHNINKILYTASIVRTDSKAINRLVALIEGMKPEIVVTHIHQSDNDFKQSLYIRGFQALIRETITYSNLRFVRFFNKDILKGIEIVAQDEKADVLVLLKKNKTFLTSIINKINIERLAFNLNIPIIYFSESYLN